MNLTTAGVATSPFRPKVIGKVTDLAYSRQAEQGYSFSQTRGMPVRHSRVETNVHGLPIKVMNTGEHVFKAVTLRQLKILRTDIN